ncbi:hypothetical protein BDW59DRAFT_163458 [Aspergillus cavernicola]|uniref:Rhodopsin domain-containing protein n=1 Tax=Aspergillus cavernicola TaxID=176166 RepID=A0ABR4I6B4_9EURO
MSTNDPPDILHTVNLVTQCLCIPIVTLFVLLRFSIRAYYRQWAGVEDWTCFFAWILFMGYCGIAIMAGKYGGGFHYSDVSDENLVLYRKFCYVATVLYCPMALLTKVALLSILIRIFAPYKSKILFIYIFLGAIALYYTIAEIVKIRICDPVPAYWTGAPASCLDQRAALIADSVISMVSDILILVLPLPLTWSLQMSRNKKLRVIGMLSAGGLATAFSIYRLVLVLRDGSSPDITIVFICVILSGNAEGGVGLICACLPSLNIIIAKVRNHSYKSSNRYYEQHDSTMQLSRVNGASTNAKGISMNMSRQDPESHEVNSDQSHLISYAGAVDRSHAGPTGAIHKTVNVSQTVEVVDDESEAQLGRGGPGRY